MANILSTGPIRDSSHAVHEERRSRNTDCEWRQQDVGRHKQQDDSDDHGTETYCEPRKQHRDRERPDHDGSDDAGKPYKQIHFFITW